MSNTGAIRSHHRKRFKVNIANNTFPIVRPGAQLDEPGTGSHTLDSPVGYLPGFNLMIPCRENIIGGIVQQD